MEECAPEIHQTANDKLVSELSNHLKEYSMQCSRYFTLSVLMLQPFTFTIGSRTTPEHATIESLSPNA